MHIENGLATLSNGLHLHEAKCVSKKKPFATEEDAVAFEKRSRETNQFPRQWAYKCDDCPDWHLTSTAPGAPTIARTNYAAIANSAARVPHGETKAKVKELFNRGVTRTQIAEQLNISYQSVCAHLREDKSKESSPPVVTLENLAVKEKQLEAELQRVQQERQRLIELRALKVVLCWEGKGILISKEGDRLALSLDDCTDLVTKLEEILTSAGQKEEQ